MQLIGENTGVSAVAFSPVSKLVQTAVSFIIENSRYLVLEVPGYGKCIKL